jgi:hypothetical protein
MKHLLILFFLGAFGVNGQRNIFIHLDAVYSNNALDISTTYLASDNTLFRLDHFDYYVSNIVLTHDGGQQTMFLNQVFLIEPTNQTIYLGFLPIQQIESVDFLVGVPKELNTQSGVFSQDISTYPETHPLSFQSPSMYWGWQAGYMHMILGGWNDINGNNNIETNEGYFELHNLGDQNQQSVSITSVIQTNTSSDQTDVFINCHLDRWIENIPLGTSGVAHGSTGVNEILLNNVTNQTVFEQSPTAGIQPVGISQFTYSVAKGELTVYCITKHLKNIHLTKADGTIVYQHNFTENCDKLVISSLIPGIYFINSEDKNGVFQKTVFIP